MNDAESKDIPEQALVDSGLIKDQEEIPSSPLMQEMLALIEAQPDVEAKLTLAISFMAQALAQSGLPHFQAFWAFRRLCQTFFKESISQGARLKLWTHY